LEHDECVYEPLSGSTVVSSALTSSDIATATVAAISSAMASAQMSCVDGQRMALASQTVAASFNSAMAGTQAHLSAVSSDENAMLASLQQNAHDQVMEIMSSYHNTSHRRRSSVEAAAAASSVLASIANSTKSYMDGDMAAAAMAAAVAGDSPQSMAQINSYTASHSSQHNAAAAALLAASGMHSVMLPTIPSVSTSQQGTPAPGERISISSCLDGAEDDVAGAAVGDATLQGFDVAAFGELQSQAFSSSEQIASNYSASAAELQSALLKGPSPPLSALDTTPTKTPGRRRKAAAVSKAGNDYDSATDDDDDDDMDGMGGMPLTPDAPGSGRPGSLRHLTPDERRARRLQRNRLAAKECRQKKKAYIQNLESQVCDLQEENAGLRREIEELNVKIALSGMRASSSAPTPTAEFKLLAPPRQAAALAAGQQLTSPTFASKRPRMATRSPSSEAMRCDE
ncbi:hypothetical protein GGI02_005320, partial [Coemansia sp. RSA 2322]